MLVACIKYTYVGSRHNPSYLPPRKPSSDASSPIPLPTGPEQPWCTDIPPGRQTASPPLTGQMPFSLLKAYAHLLDPAVDPTCPLCKEKPQALEHWLQRCPNLDVPRQRTFGSPSPPLGVLTIDLRRCWRSLGPPSRVLGARLNNNNLPHGGHTHDI